MLMVLLMHCVNSSTVVDPSKLITYSKYNQNLSPTTYTVKTDHILVQQKQLKLIIYNKNSQNLSYTTNTYKLKTYHIQQVNSFYHTAINHLSF